MRRTLLPLFGAAWLFAGAVAAQRVLKLFPHPVAEAVVLGGHGDARQGRADGRLSIQGREAAAGESHERDKADHEQAHQPTTRLTMRSLTTTIFLTV